MAIDLKNKKVWVHYVIISIVVYFIYPTVSNIISTIINLGPKLNDLIAILILVVVTDVLSEKYLDIR